jgi:ketosteroid isomerase-like protein
MPRSLGILFAFTALLTSGDSIVAQGTSDVRSITAASDSAAVLRAASRFHAALETGDTAAVRTLIAPDLQVLEGGEVESRSQYFAHHLAADIEFARAVPSKRTVVSYTRDGNVVWLVSTSTTTGNFRGREVNSVGAELMILSGTPEGWKIRSVHWSSARRQPPR